MEARLQSHAAAWVGRAAWALVMMVLAGCVSTQPAALPSGATALTLKRQPAPPIAFIRGGCPMALISPAVIERDGDEMIFVSKDIGVRMPLSWPSGFSARVLNGELQSWSRPRGTSSDERAMSFRISGEAQLRTET